MARCLLCLRCFLFLSLFLPILSIAQIKVRQVDTRRQLVVAAIGGESVKEGDEFTATFSDRSQCSMEVQSIQGDLAVLNADSCPLNQVKVGQRLQPSLLSAMGVPASKISQGETWYTMWNYAPLSFTTISDNLPSTLDGTAGGVAFELLGFYWPIYRPGLILGGVLNGFSEFKEAASDATSILSRSTANASALYFVGQEVGRGFFVRADAGLGISEYEYYRTRDNNNDINKSETTPSIAVGLGGGLPLSEETRMLFQLLHQRDFGGEIKISNTQILAGFLF